MGQAVGKTKDPALPHFVLALLLDDHGWSAAAQQSEHPNTLMTLTPDSVEYDPLHLLMSCLVVALSDPSPAKAADHIVRNNSAPLETLAVVEMPVHLDSLEKTLDLVAVLVAPWPRTATLLSIDPALDEATLAVLYFIVPGVAALLAVLSAVPNANSQALARDRATMLSHQFDAVT